MNTHDHLERAEELLNLWSRGTTRPQANRLDVEIEAGDLLPAVSALVDARWGYLAAVTGLDPGVETGSLWTLYHFADGAAVVTLRVTIPRDNPAVPTIRELVPLAGIYERELSEVLGVSIVGTPKDGRLFIPDDWPDGVYPLRKDFRTA